MGGTGGKEGNERNSSPSPSLSDLSALRSLMSILAIESSLFAFPDTAMDMPALDLRDVLGRAIAGTKVAVVSRERDEHSSLEPREAMLGGDEEFTDAGGDNALTGSERVAGH